MESLVKDVFTYILKFCLVNFFLTESIWPRLASNSIYSWRLSWTKILLPQPLYQPIYFVLNFCFLIIWNKVSPQTCSFHSSASWVAGVAGLCYHVQLQFWIFIIYIYLCRGGICATANMWRSEGNLQESDPSYCVGSLNWSPVVRPGSKIPFPSEPLTSPTDFFMFFWVWCGVWVAYTFCCNYWAYSWLLGELVPGLSPPDTWVP